MCGCWSRCSAILIAVVCAAALCVPGIIMAADPSTGGGNRQLSRVYGTVWVKDVLPLQPIAGSLVEIPELGRYAYTDSEGRYSIDNVPWGYYLMTAYAENYTSSEYFRVCVGALGAPTCNVNYHLSPTPTAWLLMFYAAFDCNLDGCAEGSLLPTLIRAMVPTDSVRALALVDRLYNWSDAGNANTRLYEVRSNEAILLEDKGELDMAAPETLADFVTQAVSMYPASRYMLTIMDHGMGWEGSCYDVTSQITSEELGYPISGTVTDTLTIVELGAALADSLNRTGELIDVVEFEACSVQYVELAYEIRNQARALIGSEVIYFGINRDWILTDIIATPSMDALTLASNFVDRIEEWVHFLEPNSDEATISALDLIFMDALGAPLDDLSRFLYELLPTKRDEIEACRAAAQATGFDGIDLLDFIIQIERAKLSKDRAYLNSITSIKTAFNDVVVAEYHNDFVPGANGMAIYHPECFYYGGSIGTFDKYVEESFGWCPELISGSYYTAARDWALYLKGFLRPYDDVAPYLGIKVPTDDLYYTTNLTTLIVGGMAYDAYGISRVEWRDWLAGTPWCLASGTTEWSFTFNLTADESVIQVAAYDYNGNVRYGYMVITYIP
jgi:hypothetical protein